MVEQPAKVMRIGSMIRQLLEEVRAAPLDEASRIRLREIHQSSIKELEDGLAPELVEELERLSLPFTDERSPSDAELRIAQAQLVGWLEGLFHGIQTTLFAQQMAARAQLEQMRRGRPQALPARRRRRAARPRAGPDLEPVRASPADAAPVSSPSEASSAARASGTAFQDLRRRRRRRCCDVSCVDGGEHVRVRVRDGVGRAGPGRASAGRSACRRTR